MKKDVILVINVGSSSVKFALFALNGKTLVKVAKGLGDALHLTPTVEIEFVETGMKKEITFSPSNNKEDNYNKAFEFIFEIIKENDFNLLATGHRVVHGGDLFKQSVVATDDNIKALSRYNKMTPLHQPFNLQGVAHLKKYAPNIKHIMAFDTAFHTTIDPLVSSFAIPSSYTEKGVKRYGFHGLSYTFIVEELKRLLGSEQSKKKFVVAHLGNGSSLTAIENHKAKAHTLGVGAIGGLMMGTRADTLDSSAIFFLMEEFFGSSIDKTRDFLYKECGLQGVSGISSDMRALESSSDPKAKMAIDMFINRIVSHIGMMTAELQGFDGLVFTAGIGENAVLVREEVLNRLKWLGLEFDKNLNNSRIKVPTKISTANSKTEIWVIPTDEEIVIAGDVRDLIS